MSTLADLQTLVYDDCPYTTFPVAVDKITRKADISLSTKSLVDSYYNLIAINDFAGAGNLINNNPALKQVIVTQEDINKLRDGLVAVERVFNEYIAQYIATVVQPKGTWNSTATYEKYNVVTYKYNGQVRSYIALPQNEEEIQVPVGTKPAGGTNSAKYWTCITQEGLQGASGTGLSPRGAYASDVTYYENDLVVSDGYLYIANTNNIVGETPSDSNDNWTMLHLNAATDVYSPGLTINPAEWRNKAFYIVEPTVDSNTVVEVYFNKSSLDAAAKSCIVVSSENSNIKLECMDNVPTDEIVIDYFRLRKDIVG